MTTDVPPRARVLHVTHSLDFGGVESHLRTIARTRGGRFRHDFCALRSGGAAADAIKSTGAEVTVLGIDPWANPLRCFGRLAELMRKVRPEIVHTHGAEGNLFGILAARFSGVPVRIGEEIGIPEHSFKARIVFRLVYGFASRVIAVSGATRAATIALGEVSEGKIICIANPVEIPKAKSTIRKLGEQLRIGFVGRLEAVKNAVALVEAMILLPPGLDCHLLLIGDGSERPTIEQFIRTNQLEDKVKLAGYHDAPAMLLADCHVYVQPSRTEGFAIALIEAMGSGLPPIATVSGGMAEIIEDGVTGWLIDSGNPEEIATAIERAARLDPRDLARIGDAARRSVENRFAPPNYLRELETLYDECTMERQSNIVRSAFMAQTPTNRGNSRGPVSGK